MVFSYLTDDDHDGKITKDIKTFVIKREIKFHDFEEWPEINKAILKSKQRLRSDVHNVFNKKVSTIASRAIDDKKIQRPDRVTIYPYSYG